jgi:molybdenum cofactor cytidylyltransferase
MGQLKQLLSLGSKTVIRHCLDTLLHSGIRDIVMVVGVGGEEIVNAVYGLPVRVARNLDQESEMAESVRVGLRAVGTESSGILVCLSDHPLVKTETLVTLIQSHREDPERIIIPQLNGKRGHPTLFPRPVMEEILDNLTLRDIVYRNPARVREVDVPDEGILLDMDTIPDYQGIRERFMDSGH